MEEDPDSNILSGTPATQEVVQQTDEERGESGFVSPLTFVFFLGIMFALLVIITQTTEWGEENQEMFFGDFIFKLILIPVFIAVFGWNGFFGGQGNQRKKD